MLNLKSFLPTDRRSGKKGQLSTGAVLGLAGGVIGIIVVGVILVALSNVNTQLGSGAAANSLVANTSNNLGQGIANASANLPTMTTILVLVAIVSLILGAFAFFR